jgi:molybdate transport system substrate-binding protein
VTRRLADVLVAIMTSSAILLGCASLAGCATATPQTDLTIFGAASLKDVLDDLATAYEAAHPEMAVTLSSDSSAALATQIEQGAPADVFLSADRTNAQRLVDDGFASGDAIDFAANAVTIIVPADDPGDVATPADLGRAGLKVIAAGEAVPITSYATQLIDALAGEPGYPADFSASYRANVVSREDNVRAIVAKIELGEGDAGIVYRTDAIASNGVETVDLPGDIAVVATYAGVVVSASPDREAARMFIDWLTGPDGQAILAEHGFGAP